MSFDADDPWPFQRELDLRSGPLISVTTILRRSGMVRFHQSKQHIAQLAQEGRDVHQVCEDIARKGTGDYWSDLAAVAPYARGFLKFIADFNFQVEMIEERLVHPHLGYSGRLDMAGWLFGNSRSRRRLTIVDVKLGCQAPSHQYQTVGYAELVNLAKRFGNAMVTERWCIYLQSEKYIPKQHDNPHDFLHFTGLLTTARLREKAGLISERDETAFDDLLAHPENEWVEPRL